MPYEYLVEKLQPERNLSHNPLFQVMFVLHNTASEKVELSDLSINYLPINNKTARFDLSLDMYETKSGLIGSFEYNTDLFKAETIDRLVSHLENLLTGITVNPDLLIAKIYYLTATERQQLLGNLNIVNYPQNCLVHELFENMVKAYHGTPLENKIALVTNTISLTYIELNGRINQLAHYLQLQGINSNTLVGILLNRDNDLIISLLAVLKTGAAYIPLDPNYPRSRIDYIINDANISFLITKNDSFKIPKNNISVINLNQEKNKIETCSKENLNVDIQPQDLA